MGKLRRVGLGNVFILHAPVKHRLPSTPVDLCMSHQSSTAMLRLNGIAKKALHQYMQLGHWAKVDKINEGTASLKYTMTSQKRTTRV